MVTCCTTLISEQKAAPALKPFADPAQASRSLVILPEKSKVEFQNIELFLLILDRLDKSSVAGQSSALSNARFVSVTPRSGIGADFDARLLKVQRLTRCRIRPFTQKALSTTRKSVP
jgi:hypothetical protein